MRTVMALTVCLAVGSIVGCDSDHPRFAGLSDAAVNLAGKLRDNRSLNHGDAARAIQNARNAKLSVVFVHVGWSADSIVATYPLAQFMCDHYSARPSSEVLFHYVDYSDSTDDYALLREIPGWRELEREVGSSLIQGYGEVAWLKNGRVLRVESFRGVMRGGKWDRDIVERFVAITDELMVDAT